MSQFVHLRVHTEYSLLDSVVRVPELIDATARAGMPGIALTDETNLFAMVKFYRAAQARGLKPIVGVDVRLRDATDRQEPARLTLLSQNLAGYRNLTQLITRAYLEGQRRGVPLIDRNWLTSSSTVGLIALSGAQDGDIGRALLGNRGEEARRFLGRWLELFDNRFYVEVQRLGRPNEEEYLDAVLRLVAECPTPIVATNDVRFLRPQDFESHEARVCIQEGSLLADRGRQRRYTEQQYLRSPAEMTELFADLPEALENSVEIARRCSLELKLGESRLPEYPVPEGITEADYLRGQARDGLERRLAGLLKAPAGAARDRTAYQQRLTTELDTICSMGFAGYFLIVADFIRWARENDIPVGPGRGSGAGSLVAWSIGITDLDPLEHDLLFERFLNPERVSMPDFDIDFCMQGRDRVIDYVADKYGRDRVSQIITYGTMAAKAVVRDVGRVQGMSYGYVDRIAKLIPFELGITLDKALQDEQELKRLYEAEEEIRSLIDLARSLEGLTRNAGTHAGGVVIAPSMLTDFTPLFCEEGSHSVVTQFDKDDVEAAGLVKFDFLGLRTLTIIDWTVKAINAQRQVANEALLEIAALPMDDPATFALLKSCRTNAIFQLESRGMKDLIRRLQPDRFEDIVALVALFRPGPLQSGMVDDFIARKHGRTDQPIDYLHPDLKPVLAGTYGVILYQEQVMQIAQVLAGYTLGGADLLRRAMGKKKPEEMAKQRSVFTDGAVRRGVPEPRARHIFDLMEKFAGYGFNKSHSAAYALLSYQTAWLKAHYPAQFMAAVLSADMDRTDKVVTLIDECVSLGLQVEPPDINSSQYDFTVSGAHRIRYGLGAVKGVGRSAVEALIAERGARGPFASIENVCRRLDLNRVNKRVLEALIRSGCLDSLGHTRNTLMSRLSAAMHMGEQTTRAQAVGQDDLFGLASGPVADSAAGREIELPEWPEATRLAGERDTLGLYLTGHPIAQYEAELSFLTSGRLGDLASGRPVGSGEGGRWQPGRNVTVAGLVLEVRRRTNRVTLVLDDRSGRIEVMLYEETYQQHRDIIAKDAILLAEGQMRFDEFSEGWRLSAKRLLDIDRAREQQARRLILQWPAGVDGSDHVRRLIDILKPYVGGNCRIQIGYRSAGASGALVLDEQWLVRPTQELIEQLKRLVGTENLRVVYGARGAGDDGGSSIGRSVN
jgi:DNA polymerase III subunit alpha